MTEEIEMKEQRVVEPEEDRHHDATAHRWTEEAWREDEEKYRHLVERANDGIAIAQDSLLKYINPQFAKLLGYTVEEITGTAYADYILPDELPQVADRYRRRIAGEAVEPKYETALVHKDGRRVEIEVNAGIISYQGRPADFVFIRDVTERKRAEEALRESEIRYRTLFESVPLGIGLATLDGRVLESNDAMLQMTGYSAAELQQVRLADIYENPKKRELLVQQMQADGLVRNFETRLKRKDGTSYHVSLNVTPFKLGGEDLLLAVAEDITERKLAEKTLKAMTSRYEAILAAAPDIVMEVDTNKVYTWANQAGFEFFGEDVLGKEVEFYFEGEQDTYAVVQPLFNGDENTTYVESWQRRRDGEPRLLAWWSRVLKDAEGNVTGALSTARDITERVRAEEALHLSEEKFSKAFSANPDPITLTTLKDGRYFEVNDSFTRITGYRREEAIGRTSAEINLWLDPKDRARATTILQERGTLRDFEANLRMKSGEIRVVLMSSEVIEMGGEKYLLTISKDITDRKQTEETLRMYLVAMNASIDGLAITGQDEEYVYLNAAHAQIYGYDDPEEIIGKTWRDLYDAEEITRIEQEVLPRLREEGRWRGEAIGKRRGGSTFYQELSLTQMAGNRIVSAVRDITERKLAVEKIRRLNEELEQRVIERTAQLEAANQDLKSFAYSVSHDLRAPLRAINGFAQIIARRHGDSLNEEAQHYFGNIVTASAHMSQLIDDLLLYSRVGRQAVRRQPVPLGALLAQVAANLSDRVAETGAHFSLPDDLPIVSGDHTLLTQVFTNLFDNALVYRRPGVVPRVVVKSQTKTDAFIISISDNGIGIPPEFHEKIFSIFQRLHSQEEYPGTGIGLAIVKKAAGLMGGQVWVESVVGQGSTFYVELPREAREVK